MNLKRPFLFVIIFSAFHALAQKTIRSCIHIYPDFTVVSENQQVRGPQVIRTIGLTTINFFSNTILYPAGISKTVYQLYFKEYHTQTIHQKAPDGTEVYRFRNQANLPGLRLSYFL